MARTEYLAQVNGYGILPIEPKNGVPSELYWYNEDEIELIKQRNDLGFKK